MVKYTDETLKQLHSTILEMLIEFDRICRKYNIPYIRKKINKIALKKVCKMYYFLNEP